MLKYLIDFRLLCWFVLLFVNLSKIFLFFLIVILIRDVVWWNGLDVLKIELFIIFVILFWIKDWVVDLGILYLRYMEGVKEVFVILWFKVYNVEFVGIIVVFFFILVDIGVLGFLIDILVLLL